MIKVSPKCTMRDKQSNNARIAAIGASKKVRGGTEGQRQTDKESHSIRNFFNLL